MAVQGQAGSYLAGEKSGKDKPGEAHVLEAKGTGQSESEEVRGST